MTEEEYNQLIASDPYTSPQSISNYFLSPQGIAANANQQMGVDRWKANTSTAAGGTNSSFMMPGSPEWAAAVVMGGAAAGGGLGGGQGGLTGVNYQGQYLPQVTAGAGGGGASSGGGGFFSSLFGGGGGAAGAGKMGFGASDWLNLGGMLLGGVSANSQANSQQNAAQNAINASKFTPYNTSTPGGGVAFGPGQQAMGQFSGANQGIYDQLQGLAGGLLGGNSQTAGYQNFANSLGNGGIQNLFQSSMSQNGMNPMGQYLSAIGQLQGLGGQNQQAINGLFGSLGANPFQQGQDMFGQAQGLAGQDQTSLINSNLDLLRQQAKPLEQQQTSDLMDTLYGQGRMGSTGGGLDITAFAKGLGQADVSRQMAAQQLGLQAQNQNFQGAGILGNLGAQSNQSALGMLGQLGNYMNTGSNLATQGYNTAANYSDLTNSRSQQDLSNGMNLFGFGNQLGQQNYNQGINALGASQNMDTSLRNLISMGGNLGSANSNAGANAMQAYLAQGANPLAAFGSSFASGLITPMNQGNKNIQPIMGGQNPYQGYQG